MTEDAISTAEQDDLALAEQRKAEANELHKQGSFYEALELYSQAIDLAPNMATLYCNRAAALTMLKRFHAASLDCLAAIALDPSFTKAHIRAAKCYTALGNLTEASRHLSLAAEKDPSISVQAEIDNVSSIQKVMASADQAFKTGDYRRAIFNLDTAVNMSSGGTYWPHSWAVMKSEALVASDRTNEANLILNDILREDSNNVSALYVRGRIFYLNGDLARALTFLKESLRVDPDHQSARLLFKTAKSLDQAKEAGNVAFKSGNHDEALELYSQALQIDPSNRQVNCKLFSNMSTVLSKLGRYDEAIKYCNDALGIDPEFFKVILRRADCFMKMEKYEEAVRDYELAHSLDKSNREVRQALKTASLELKKSKRKDHYKILGVSRDASDGEIKKAYRKQALIYHPDKTQDESKREEYEAKFKDIAEAYDILSDPQKKMRFDSGADLDGGMGGAGSAVNPEDIFSMFFAQQQAGGFGGQRGFHSGGFPGHRHHDGF